MTLNPKLAEALAVTVTVSVPEAAVYWPHQSSTSSFVLELTTFVKVVEPVSETPLTCWPVPMKPTGTRM